MLLPQYISLGKTEGTRRRGWQRMRWLDGIIKLMGMNLGKLWEIVEDRGGLACCSPWDHKESDTTQHLNNHPFNGRCSFIPKAPSGYAVGTRSHTWDVQPGRSSPDQPYPQCPGRQPGILCGPTRVPAWSAEQQHGPWRQESTSWKRDPWQE